MTPPGNSMDSAHHHQSSNLCFDEDDEKGHTFRKRRLTLTSHHLDNGTNGNAAGDAVSPNSSSDGTKKKRKTDQAFSEERLQARVVHAGELHNKPKSSPTSSSSPSKHCALYHAPRRIEPVQTEADRARIPAWRHRHAHHPEEKTLPFPRSVVGTYSCHGVEPVYDSDYDPLPLEDDDEEEEWVPPGDDEDEPEASPVARHATVAKTNQDRGGVAFPYGNCPRTALFAVYDGHGQGGELVSQYALHEVQSRLEKHKDFTSDLKNAFIETFVAVDKDLAHEPCIQPLYAGTTACAVLLRDDVLTISNCGDSRAVCARKTKSGQYIAIPLSEDQNPDVPEEQERIERCGGFVSPPPEEGLSARVWLDSNYSQIGLAMARSLGDHSVSPVGVIATPVVTTHKITDEDDFLILATDGVWEFLSSEDAVSIVSKHLKEGSTKACQALIEAAASKWHDEEGNYRDDITALVVRLQELW